MNEPSNEALLLSAINNGQDLHSEKFDYKSTFLNCIEPDRENARFFPAIMVSDADARLFIERKISKRQLAKSYDAEEYVLIGKSLLINCLKHGTPDWNKANSGIDSIMELGSNILESDLIHAPTIYPLDSSNHYRIVTGHRRFFALLYANGSDSAAQFKVYSTKPYLLRTKQFVENASREDLSPHGKLQAFSNAMFELEGLNNVRLRISEKKLTVRDSATKLGISMGAFDNYNVLTRYPSVITSYENGLRQTFMKVKKIVLDTEAKYRLLHDKKQLNIGDKKTISSQIDDILNGNIIEQQSVSEQVKIKSIQSPKIVKTLLESNILEMDIGIVWDDIDWESAKEVKNTVNFVIDFLHKKIDTVNS
jgi:hypothetical protein